MDDQIPDDGLKWFGEGFDGFPKRLPDDCVEYALYVIDQKLEGFAAIRLRLNEVSKAANALKKRLLKDYIWQRDSFELNVHPKADLSKSAVSGQSLPHLRGRVNFGDSVADEWLVVYLLKEISQQFADVWIRVYDTDGEFLLIEAANSLPKWLNPEIAENRVWLNDGHLKLLPLNEETTSRNLSLSDAHSTILNSPKKLLIQPAIEKEAFYRLREYPSAISSSLHHALATIPRRLAYVLRRNAAYISPAVESFYLRDPVSLKPLATKDLATLNFPPEDFITVSISYTKVGYAQLRSQLFDAPPAWVGILPRMKDERVAMGMKLTCGFEMLVSDPHNQDLRSVREIKLLLDDVESGEDTLPSDADVSTWAKTQDDEKWLDIDYNDFEKELSGNSRAAAEATGNGFGDPGAQENLRKMVSRFQDFLDDDKAGAEGIDDMDDDDDDDDDDSGDADNDESSDKEVNKESAEQVKNDEAEFERAMNETIAMPAARIEESGLLDEARKLAIQDDEDASDIDEDEEMRKVIELMEKELKGHGALNLDGKGKGNGKAAEVSPKVPSRPVFGPERPPNMQDKSLAKKSVHFDENEASEGEIGPGDGELSSDDEDFNDIDVELAKNMLESFKGQAGTAGPAGNMMRALGVGMPRDEDGA